MIDLTQIVVALIGVLTTVLTTVLIPYIRSKVSASQWERLQLIATVAVQAAEQLGATQVIVDKYEYAFERIQTELSSYHLSFNTNTINDAIEAAVLTMNSNADSYKSINVEYK